MMRFEIIGKKDEKFHMKDHGTGQVWVLEDTMTQSQATDFAERLNRLSERIGADKNDDIIDLIQD